MQRIPVIFGMRVAGIAEEVKSAPEWPSGHADGNFVFTVTAANLQRSRCSLRVFVKFDADALVPPRIWPVRCSVAITSAKVLFFPLFSLGVQLTLFFTPWFYV